MADPIPSSPNADGKGNPQIEWERDPDEDGWIVHLRGIPHWHLSAHGRTYQDALAFLGECMHVARQEDIYCGAPLIGGWCKRAPNHEGDHACS